MIKNRVMEWVVVFCTMFCFAAAVAAPNPRDNLYAATWEDLNRRPLPRWYDHAKIGIMLRWGVFSVPAFSTSTAGSESFVYEWRTNSNREVMKYLEDKYDSTISYKKMAENFTAEFFDSDEWTKLFKDAGAKYVIISAKSSDGYTLFDAARPTQKKPNDWNSVLTGPSRDIVREIKEAVVKEKMRFGVYYSLTEWYSKSYEWDKKHHFRTNYYVMNRVIPHLVQLVNQYEPSVIWSDGEWEDGADARYFNSTTFLAWLYNKSPVRTTAVVNDRWGLGTSLRCGDFYNGPDRFNPRVRLAHKWENVLSLDKHSWGYSKIKTDYMTFDELLENIVSTVSCGGNALLGIGPTSDGEIPDQIHKVLKELGSWLKINGQAIYHTVPWIHQHEKESNVWFTCRATRNFAYNATNPMRTPDYKHTKVIYAIFFDWPDDNLLQIKVLRKLFSYQKQYVQILDVTVKEIEWWELTNEAVVIKLPDTRPTENYGWTLRITKIKRKESPEYEEIS